MPVCTGAFSVPRAASVPTSLKDLSALSDADVQRLISRGSLIETAAVKEARVAELAVMAAEGVEIMKKPEVFGVKKVARWRLFIAEAPMEGADLAFFNEHGYPPQSVLVKWFDYMLQVCARATGSARMRRRACRSCEAYCG